MTQQSRLDHHPTPNRPPSTWIYCPSTTAHWFRHQTTTPCNHSSSWISQENQDAEGSSQNDAVTLKQRRTSSEHNIKIHKVYFFLYKMDY